MARKESPEERLARAKAARDALVIELELERCQLTEPRPDRVAPSRPLDRRPPPRRGFRG